MRMFSGFFCPLWQCSNPHPQDIWGHLSCSIISLPLSSVSPQSLADTDLSPAEEETPSAAADFKSDNKSEDESDDTPSVWSQQDVYSLKLLDCPEELSITYRQSKAETVDFWIFFFFLTIPEGTYQAVIGAASWPRISPDCLIKWILKRLR